MKIDITYRNINKESHESTRTAIEQITTRNLSPKLAAFDVGHLGMHATVELTTHDGYCVTYRLHLPPKKILIAKECHDNLRSAIQNVTSDLTRQAKRHNAHVKGRQNWKRKGRDKRLESLHADIKMLEPAVLQSLKKKVIPLQPRLENFIRHELVYLRSNGDLLADYPRLADIRDEAVARLHLNWHKLDGTDETVYKKLLREVTIILSQEVEYTKINAENISLDDPISPDAMDQAEAMVGDEQSEFYQPDEVLHVQDLIPDSHVVSQDITVDSYQDHFYRYLGGLPIQWRRTVLLANNEGLSIEDIAKHVLSTTTKDVERMVSLADLYMYERLKEAGFEPSEEETTKLFFSSTL